MTFTVSTDHVGNVPAGSTRGTVLLNGAQRTLLSFLDLVDTYSGRIKWEQQQGQFLGLVSGPPVFGLSKAKRSCAFRVDFEGSDAKIESGIDGHLAS